METAKFCGNCGSPFPRNAQPSSSLVNCAQGHVYSAVYEHCPYCPQPERQATPADFATRIETGIETTIEPPATVVQPPPSSSRTEQVRRDYATVIEPGMGATDPISSAPTADSFAGPTSPQQPPAIIPTQVGAPPLASQRTEISPQPELPPPPPPAPAKSPVPPAPKSAASTPRVDRRTVVVSAEEVQQVPTSRGKLVGWIVSFARNPDGEDFRLRAGRNVLGANPNCDIVIEDEAVSGVHASIIYRNGRCLIKDELSSNGTFVNGVEVDEPRPLQSYDEILIGNTPLVFISLERTA